jgi:hypothetical protein
VLADAQGFDQQLAGSLGRRMRSGGLSYGQAVICSW